MLLYGKRRTTANGGFAQEQSLHTFECDQFFQKKQPLFVNKRMMLSSQLAVALTIFSLGSVLPAISHAADTPVSDACTNPTKTAKRNNGEIVRWGSADSWIPTGVPTASDAVLIPGGSTVSISPLDFKDSNTTVNDVVIPKVGAFCVNGTVIQEEYLTIQGSKFNDLNGNGVREPNEKGMPFETILIRYNDLADKGLPGQYTVTTDVEGNYSLTGMLPGSYMMRTTLETTSWQTTPMESPRAGVPVSYNMTVPVGVSTYQVDFGVWDGIEREECTLCAAADDAQTDAGEQTVVGGVITDNEPDDSDLTITVEAFGFSTVKVVSAEDRVAKASIPVTLPVTFPKGGNYPVKVTAKSGAGEMAESEGNVTVRDVDTSDACDMNVQTIWSTRSGKWDDPTLWTGGRVPNANDWVMIRSSHEVKIPAATTVDITKNQGRDLLKVKGLCVDQGAKLGNFYYKEWKTQPIGLSANYSEGSNTRRSDACDLTPTITAKNLTPPGSWEDRNTWTPRSVPRWNDIAYIPPGVTVVVPYTTTTNTHNVDSLCNEGTLTSPTELPPDNQQYWLAIKPNNLHNKGTIKSNDGFNGGNGVGIYLGEPNEMNNDGTIQSGTGSPGAGNGGPIEINPNNISNTGKIQLGNGGYCNAHMGTCSKSGDGGTLNINALGTADIGGTIQGGSGGDAGSVSSGAASTLNINANPANVADGAVVQGQTGRYYKDPIQLTIGNNININSGDIYFVSDDNGRIDVAELNEGAITATRTITFSVGEGGVIDLRQVSDKALQAGDSIIFYADEILLPEGKTLEDLVDTPHLVVEPAKLLAMAAWSNTDETLVGKPGESMELPLTLRNIGPAEDTYDLSISDEQSWELCKLPQTVSVNSRRHVDLECKVTLPETYDAENLVTVTATSQNDPSLTITSQLRLKVDSEFDEIDETNRYAAYGTLLDKQGNPIAGVTIDLNGITTATNTSGYWEIAGLPEGDYPLTASKEGYVFMPETIGLGNGYYQNDIGIKPLSQLAVSVKSANSKTLKQGQNQSYTITVINGGDETATNVTLQDTLPEGSQLVSLSAVDGGTCDTTTLTCQLPDLTTGASAQVNLEITDLPSNTMENMVIVSANEYPNDMKKTRNHVDPYLSVQVKDQADPVVLGSELHYELTVDLNEFSPTSKATGIQLTSLLPQGVALKSVSTNDGQCESADNQITCSLDDLSIANAGDKSRAIVDVSVTVEDGGMLLLNHEARISSNEYPDDMHRERTKVFVQDTQVDMVLVLDTTHSMLEEKNAVIAALKTFIQDKMADTTMQVALVEFKDDVKLKVFTSDMQVLLKAVEKLDVSGGGTCPEASVEALNLAVDHLKDNGIIFFTTDASPYEEADVDTLIERIGNKGIQLTTVITGDCADGENSWNDVKSEEATLGN